MGYVLKGLPSGCVVEDMQLNWWIRCSVSLPSFLECRQLRGISPFLADINPQSLRQEDQYLGSGLRDRDHLGRVHG